MLVLIFFAAVLFTLPVQAQVSCDSLSGYYKKIRETFKIDREATLSLIAEAKEQFDGEACPEARADILKMDGVMHYRVGAYPEAIQVLRKSMEICEQYDYEEGLANTWYNMALVYANLGDRETSLKYFFKCMEVDEKNGNVAGLAYCYHTIGDNLIDLGRKEEARGYFEKSLAIRKKLNDPYASALGHIGMGGYYYELRQGDSALYHYEKALEFERQTNDIRSEASTLSNIGNCYFIMAEYPKAIIYNRKALQLMDDLDDRYNHTIVLNAIAYVHHRREEYDSARYYALMALDTAIKYEYKSLVYSNMYLLQEVEWYDGNPEMAFEYLSRAKALDDTLRGETQLVKLNELRSSFDIKMKENELSAQKALLEQEENYTQRLMIGLGILFLVLLVVLILLMIVVRIRQRLRQQNEEMARVNVALARSEQELAASNKLKDQFFSIVAHDIKAPLINLRTLMYLVRSLPEVQRSPVVNEQVQVLDEEVLKVSALLDNLLYWAINQQKGIVCQYETVDVGKLLAETTELWQKYMESKSLTLDLQLEGDLSITTDKQMLYFILRNLMSNAVKFTHPKGKITIRCRRLDGALHLVVADQGIGMEQQQIENLFVAEKVQQQEGTMREKGTGIGLKLVQEFLHQLDGKISVNSVKGEGSEFVVGLPVSPSTAA